jgi:hypothetical protein
LRSRSLSCFLMSGGSKKITFDDHFVAHRIAPLRHRTTHNTIINDETKHDASALKNKKNSKMMMLQKNNNDETIMNQRISMSQNYQVCKSCCSMGRPILTTEEIQDITEVGCMRSVLPVETILGALCQNKASGALTRKLCGDGFDKYSNRIMNLRLHLFRLGGLTTPTPSCFTNEPAA